MFMTVRCMGLIAVLVVLSAACGDPAGSAVSRLTTPTTATAVSAVAPPQTGLPPVTAGGESVDGVPNPDEIRWLAPSVTPSGLQLVGAHRRLVAGCGPTADCLLTVPSAGLDYESAAIATGHTVRITQWLPTPVDVQFGLTAGGVERTVDDRTVVVLEDGSLITAGWTELDGIVVEIATSQLTWDSVAELIASLNRLDPVDWPGAEVNPPAVFCVDASTQYAPSVVPDGWVRFVLDAQPSGSCGGVGPILFMSLVIPGTADGPGTLVTFVTQSASTLPAGTGDPITINDRPAALNEAVGADGTPAVAIELRFDNVVVEAHGNADTETLVNLMESVRLLDDEEWAQLVAEIATE